MSRRSGWFKAVHRTSVVSVACAVFALLLTVSPAPAQAQQCRVVQLDMTPTTDLQIVIWLEDVQGNFIETLYITQLTGSYGLGNRPGMMTFNSAWRWPYGRRTTTFPVWAHRHGMEWPLVIFQNLDDTNLSHPLGQSSNENFYCRPLREGESAWDNMSCASLIYTDKGMLSQTEVSLYPPRVDLTFNDPIDHEDVTMYAGMNPFDSVSRATPQGDMPFQFNWPIPDDVPEGDYVMWVEVSKELDRNEHYAYPEPVGIPWSEYGIAYRGQPSIVYRAPFTIGSQVMSIDVVDYVGYGDPDGLDGDVRVPDETISTGVDGSGASRLLLTADGDDLYRLRLHSRPTNDASAPDPVDRFELLSTDATSALATFLAPWDELAGEPVTNYEIRYMIGETITEDNFDEGTLATVEFSDEPPGEPQRIHVRALTPRTRYSLGIRALGECDSPGPIQVLEMITEERAPRTVEWCFVATAAYGSSMENDVQMLRRFRDRFLKTHATGELLVEGYYTFGPALARLIAPSDTLRRAARSSLSPIVDAVKSLAPQR